MFFENENGKILTENDVDTMLPWEIEEFRIHVHESSYSSSNFVEDDELLDILKQTRK